MSKDIGKVVTAINDIHKNLDEYIEVINEQHKLNKHHKQALLSEFIKGAKFTLDCIRLGNSLDLIKKAFETYANKVCDKCGKEFDLRTMIETETHKGWETLGRNENAFETIYECCSRCGTKHGN